MRARRRSFVGGVAPEISQRQWQRRRWRCRRLRRAVARSRAAQSGKLISIFSFSCWLFVDRFDSIRRRSKAKRLKVLMNSMISLSTYSYQVLKQWDNILLCWSLFFESWPQELDYGFDRPIHGSFLFSKCLCCFNHIVCFTVFGHESAVVRVVAAAAHAARRRRADRGHLADLHRPVASTNHAMVHAATETRLNAAFFLEMKKMILKLCEFDFVKGAGFSRRWIVHFQSRLLIEKENHHADYNVSQSRSCTLAEENKISFLF